MEVTLTTLEAARAGNEALCRDTLTGYRTVFNRFEQLREQLAGLDLECSKKPTPPEELKQKIQTAFAVRSAGGLEMVHHLYALP